LFYVPKFWVFENVVFYRKGVDLDHLVVKTCWFIERWEFEDPRIIPIYIFCFPTSNPIMNTSEQFINICFMIYGTEKGGQNVGFGGGSVEVWDV
jgi:hypothetical protein